MTTKPQTWDQTKKATQEIHDTLKASRGLGTVKAITPYYCGIGESAFRGEGILTGAETPMKTPGQQQHAVIDGLIVNESEVGSLLVEKEGWARSYYVDFYHEIGSGMLNAAVYLAYGEPRGWKVPQVLKDNFDGLAAYWTAGQSED